jgi:hypothetical protein
MTCKKCEIDKLWTDEYFYRRSDNGRLRKICKECVIDNQRQYNLKHRDEQLNYLHLYYENNKGEMIKQIIQCEKNRIQSDIQFKVIKRLRSRMYSALKGNWKFGHTIELLGCSIDEFKKYFKEKFQLGMNWDNYGKWHIDHVRPCALFDMSKEEEQRKCFHYTNLQPLWAKDNICKGGKIKNEI